MRIVQTLVGPLHCWDADDITRVLEATGTWDAHLFEAIDQTPTDGWALDLGANIGFFTIYLAERFERVLAIEAHPQTADLLMENLRANKVDKFVSVISAAAYDRSTTLEAASSAVHGWPEAERSFLDLDSLPHVAGLSFVETPEHQHHLHEIRVGTVKVDSLVPENAVVRLIKVDVQGAALRALEGASEVIARCRPRIIFEFEGHVSEVRGDDWPAYCAFFEERNYDLFSIPGPWSDFLAVPR